MGCANALKQLFPFDLDGVFSQDVAIEGARLDEDVLNFSLLVPEIFPDTCTWSIADWEGVYDIPIVTTDSLAIRRARVGYRALEIGSLKAVDIEAAAAAAGYTITVAKSEPFRADISCAGDLVFGSSTATFSLDIIVSGAGPYPALETLVRRLSPARTGLVFSYL